MSRLPRGRTSFRLMGRGSAPWRDEGKYGTASLMYQQGTYLTSVRTVRGQPPPPERRVCLCQLGSVGRSAPGIIRGSCCAPDKRQQGRPIKALILRSADRRIPQAPVLVGRALFVVRAWRATQGLLVPSRHHLSALHPFAAPPLGTVNERPDDGANVQADDGDSYCRMSLQRHPCSAAEHGNRHDGAGY